jgi:hypothetical protein
MSRQRTAYVQARTHLLEQMTSTLQKDERFVAAWLAESFSRGELTWLSDLDIHVVIADTYSESLCATPWPEGANTTPERLALFQQFGTPGIISAYPQCGRAKELLQKAVAHPFKGSTATPLIERVLVATSCLRRDSCSSPERHPLLVTLIGRSYGKIHERQTHTKAHRGRMRTAFQ